MFHIINVIYLKPTTDEGAFNRLSRFLQTIDVKTLHTKDHKILAYPKLITETLEIHSYTHTYTQHGPNHYCILGFV